MEFFKFANSSNESETIRWKENYFREIECISEPRGPKYKCEECQDIFNTRLSLITHSKAHLKPFCNVCGLYCNVQAEMYAHMKAAHPTLVVITQPRRFDMISNQINQQVVVAYVNATPEKAPVKSKPTKNVSRGRPAKSAQMYLDKYTTKGVTSRFGRFINVKIPDF